jgi:DNA-binding NarL/FixJ family response regulator
VAGYLDRALSDAITGSPAVRVIVADDHDLVRLAIRSLLSRIDGVQLVAEARDGNELVEATARLKPDVVLTDISMPDMDGITAIGIIHAAQPQVRLVVMTLHSEVDFVRRAVAAGASGYLMKDAAAFELDQAMRSVVQTGAYFSQAITQRLLQPPERTVEDDLTQRQIEVLKLLAVGKASKEIAFILGLSSKTVDVHRARIMSRLQLWDVAQLTMYALRKGLIQL